MKPELRYGKRTKKVTPIWMVTKCDSNHTLKDFCENSRTDETFESLIPVSVGSVTYRNHFCVTCNGIFGEDMDSWNIEFQCRTILQLPDENLLQTIKEKQCNINFIKPAKTPVDECEIVPYVTSECNVTGKWQEYDPVIDAGCQSFIDPFNLTYANVFCYLCNTERSDQSEPSICNFPSQEIFSDVSPPFSAILTLDAIMSMTKLDTSVDTLQCNKTRQFKDEKMVNNLSINTIA